MVFGLCVLLLIAGLPSAALAYIGPGAGVTMLGALWGVLAAIVLTIVGLLYWPIRAALRRRKKTPANLERSEDKSADSTTQDG